LTTNQKSIIVLIEGGNQIYIHQPRIVPRTRTGLELVDEKELMMNGIQSVWTPPRKVADNERKNRI
jgi:hypothetical protein